MDKEIRNLLSRVTQRCRFLLEEEFGQQLEGTFDIFPDGRIAEEPGAPLDSSERLIRRKIIAAIEHRRSKGESEEESVRGFLRGCAFTFLNRAAALKMMEARGIVQECISKGDESSGFREFCGLAPGLVSLPDRGYRLYLECLFDEIGREIGVLFDRSETNSHLWPRRKALETLLETLNDESLAGVWTEDETIGWIYQYYNDPAERKKMREESAAPRNSRELAVRNQFFTPRYVVEFLTDNTLGRIWYEMTQGQTRLRDDCRYLVRRPVEFFLSPPPDDAPEWLHALLVNADFSRLPEDPPESEVFAFLKNSIDPLEAMERCRLDMGSVSERFLTPLEENREVADEAFLDAHPVELLYALFRWAIGPNHDYPEPSLEPVSTRPVMGPLWAGFRKRMQLDSSGLSQAELLQQPVFLPHRQLKDPREIRLLDPACGSMHFGLYAFDLFEAIYDEAWEIAKGGAIPEGADPNFTDYCSLITDHYASKQDYLRYVPRLIIEHNIHGVDIDPRAAQIAGLSLWLRAQKTWKDTPSAERPRVRRSNIVCAEPMPGSDAMLEDFVQTLDPPLLGKLVKTVFEKMQLAGEAGTLLKIEEEIRTAIDDAKAAWTRLESKPWELFGADEMNQTLRQGAQQELTGLDRAASADLRSLTSDFWDSAEELIYAALRDYAESAEAGDYQRRLFAEDAAHGFAFIDLCRQRYDAIVMNPPFGKVVSKTKELLSEWYTESKNELYASFVTMAVSRLTDWGSAGAITSRTGFFLGSLESWRQLLLSNATPTVFADLGAGVLDSAMVETASFVVCKTQHSEKVETLFLNVLQQSDKGTKLSESTRTIDLDSTHIVHLVDSKEFQKIPGTPFAYWLTTNLRGAFSRYEPFGNEDRWVKQGLATADDFRFIRMRAETPSSLADWPPVAKGGLGSPFFQDFLLGVNWSEDGQELKAFASAYRASKGWGDQWTAMLNSHEFYFKPGLTYPLRSRRFSPQVMPAGVVISVRGSGIYVGGDMFAVMGVMASTPFDFLLKTLLGTSQQPQYDMGDLNNMPFPLLDQASERKMHDLAAAAWKIKMEVASLNELSNYFCAPAPTVSVPGSAQNDLLIGSRLTKFEGFIEENLDRLQRIEVGIDQVAYLLFALSPADIERIQDVKTPGGLNSAFEGLLEDFSVASHVEDLFSYLVGTVLGRWDICYATGERQPPELPDPFGPLPVCPPGMLQAGDGLPLAKEEGLRIEAEGNYPLRVSWEGILVDDEGHPEDIGSRVREAIAVIWSGRAEAIEQEACEILGLKQLRDYFRKPTKFFADHLKRYSKSRRQAPIYWPLTAGAGNYSVWLYYHRLTSDTLYSVLRDYVQPRLQQEELFNHRIKQEVSDNPSLDNRRKLSESDDLLITLRTLEAELKRVAPLFKPDLNDGVIINSAPLWRMIPLPKWQKDCKGCWDKLVKGVYDWAHLALHLWPERVVPKCRKDRSLAIAHDLEEVFWAEIPETGKHRHRGDVELEEAELRKGLQRKEAVALVPILKAFWDSLPTDDPNRDGDWLTSLRDGNYSQTILGLVLWPDLLNALNENPDQAKPHIETLARSIQGGDQADYDKLLAHGPVGATATVQEQVFQMMAQGVSSDPLDIMTEPFEKLTADLRKTVPIIEAFAQSRPADRSWSDHWSTLLDEHRPESELALLLHPDECIEAARADVEAATHMNIVHSFWVQDPSGNWHARLTPEEEVQRHTAWRHSPAVKAALEDLLSAPAPTGAKKKRKKAK